MKSKFIIYQLVERFNVTTQQKETILLKFLENAYGYKTFSDRSYALDALRRYLKDYPIAQSLKFTIIEELTFDESE